jgi:hypothetical protein
MSIKLHKDCNNRLKEKLGGALEKARINNLSFLDHQSLEAILDLESILPASGNVKDELQSYISESPLFDFVFGLLSKRVNESQEFSSEHPKEALSYLDEFQNIKDVANNLIDEFNSLPWQYAITFKLNNSIAEFVVDEITPISEDIRILKVGAELIDNFPLQSGIPKRDNHLNDGGLFGVQGAAEWKENTLYVQIKTAGFIGKYVTTTPEVQAIDTFKSFLGLLIAQRAIKVKHSYSTSTIKSYAYIHREHEKWIIEDSISLADDVSKTINDLKVDDLGGTLDSKERKSNFVSNRLKLLSKALSQKESEKLRLAGRWLFDSYCGSNELLSFIQTTVSLEILLGEKAISDLMGLGELLRNRCAYLIGKTHAQREEVLSDFKKIYEIRSKIVHRGKSQLSRHDRTLFHKLQWMANRVIQEEIELIGNTA